VSVLVACEYSGTVRDAFIRRGHYAMSADLLPTEAPGPHYHGDVRDILDEGWTLVIAHPPCTRLCNSGVSWLRKRDLWGDLAEGIDFFLAMLAAPSPLVAVENPRMHGIAKALIGPSCFKVQPWQFGDDASKETHFWTRGTLPPLEPTGHVASRMAVQPNGRALPRWGNQTDRGQNRLGPSEDRWKKRSKTYQGLADAMARQWGMFL